MSAFGRPSSCAICRRLIYVGDVAELARIDSSPEEIWIGAAVTCADAWPALLRALSGPRGAGGALRLATDP
jgi:xanthine dehydrogenase iron-sulfur cluster and FAD-binding subunit A